MAGLFPLLMTGRGTYAPEEIERISSIESDIKAYIGEQKTLYIVGDVKLTDQERENLTNTLKQMGIDQLLEVYQAVYDRNVK